MNNVSVPTHFFKVLVAETDSSELHMEAYVMPNQPIDDNVPIQNFMVRKDRLTVGDLNTRHSSVTLAN